MVSSKRTFSVIKSIFYGYKTVLQNSKTFISLLLFIISLSLVAIFVLGALAEILPIVTVMRQQDSVMAMAMIVGVLFVFVAAAKDAIFARLALFLHDQNDISFKYVLTIHSFTIFSVMGALILYYLFFSLGLLLLIIPGLFFLARFDFFVFLIVDKNLSAWKALKKSFALTQGNTMKMMGLKFHSIIVFFLLDVLIRIVEQYSLIYVPLVLVAIFVIWAASLLSSVYVYRIFVPSVGQDTSNIIHDSKKEYNIAPSVVLGYEKQEDIQH